MDKQAYGHSSGHNNAKEKKPSAVLGLPNNQPHQSSQLSRVKGVFEHTVTTNRGDHC